MSLSMNRPLREEYIRGLKLRVVLSLNKVTDDAQIASLEEAADGPYMSYRGPSQSISVQCILEDQD